MENTLVSAFQSVEEFYRRIYWRAPTATTVNTENYTLSYSGISWLHSVNHLWLHFAHGIDDPPLGHYLNIAERFFRQYGADYNVVFSEAGSDSELSNRLTERGYFERLRSPIMALDGIPHVGTFNRQARIVRVTEGESYDLLQV